MRDWTPFSLLQVSGGYWESCVIQAAVALDVFSSLAEGPLTVAELARSVRADPRAVGMLATALAALGLVSRRGEVCALEPFARQWLCRDSPDYLGHIILHHQHLMPGWARLDQAVREGRPVRHSSVDTEEPSEREHFLMGMRNIADALALRSVPGIDLTGRARLLDLGGGTGAYAVHFCRHNPDLTAVVFDLPTSRSFAEKVIAAEGMAGRIRFEAGNFLTDALPDGCDVAWMSQVLHSVGFREAGEVVAAAARALTPGGLLLIQEFILDDDRAGPTYPALFGLNMLVGTSKGQAYTQAELAGFLSAAGAVRVRRLPLDLPQGCGIMAGNLPG